MNLLLFEPDEIDAQGRVVLADRRARHACRVLDVAPGDRVRVGVIRGPRGTAEVLARHGDARVELAVTWSLPASPVPPVDLVLAVPRPKVLRRVVRAAASLGVRRIDLVNAWRVDRSYLASHALAAPVLRASLLEGCEQAESTWLPDIDVHARFVPFVDGELAGRLRAPGVMLLVAHPGAGQTLERAVTSGFLADGRVVAAIGPERGWIDREIESFTRLGGAVVSLGDAVLSAEVAVPALLAQLALLYRLASA